MTDTHINPIQVQKFLKGIDYPASKQDIIKTAKKEGADKQVLDALEAMSQDKFDGPNAVSKALKASNVS